jgi:hypothetical protein
MTERKFPNPEDCNVILLNKDKCFVSEDLKKATIVLSDPNCEFRQWRSRGSFACVAQAVVDEKLMAIRMMTSLQSDLYARYEKLGIFKSNNGNVGKYLLDVDFRPKEIVWNDDFFPVILFEWVQGSTLLENLIDSCTKNDEQHILLLRQQFREMRKDLLVDSFAHGDLSAENILVRPGGELVLIDYDSVYFEAVAHTNSSVGKTPLAHPKRQPNIGRSGDQVSFLIIDLALSFLAKFPDYGTRDGVFEQKFVIGVDDLIAVDNHGDWQKKFTEIALEIEKFFPTEITDLCQYLLGNIDEYPMYVYENQFAHASIGQADLSKTWISFLQDFKAKFLALSTPVRLRDILVGEPTPTGGTKLSESIEYINVSLSTCSWNEAETLCQLKDSGKMGWVLPSPKILTSILSLEVWGSEEPYWTQTSDGVKSHFSKTGQNLAISKVFNRSGQFQILSNWLKSDQRAYVLAIREFAPGETSRLMNVDASVSRRSNGRWFVTNIMNQDQITGRADFLKKNKSIDARRNMIAEMIKVLFSIYESEHVLFSGLEIGDFGQVLNELGLQRNEGDPKLKEVIQKVCSELNSEIDIFGLKLLISEGLVKVQSIATNY